MTYSIHHYDAEDRRRVHVHALLNACSREARRGARYFQRKRHSMNARSNQWLLPSRHENTGTRFLAHGPEQDRVKAGAPVTVFYIQHVRPLGQGGLATVDVVEVISDGGPYVRGTQLARKQLGPRWSTDPGAQQRFEQEIATLSSMRHPGVIHVAGVSIPGHPRCYTMPLYPMSLRTLLQQHAQPFALPWVVHFGLKICRTLQYAHGLGFIHRDLKPENILLNSMLEPVVADWGLGQFIHHESKVLDLQGQNDQLPYYCPAEQWSTGRCDASGDIYSLGLILAELVVGYRIPLMPAFSGIKQDVLRPITPQASYFNQTIRRMTNLFAYARHQSMGELEVDLLGCL